MISYDPGEWGIGFIWSLKGSVFSRSLWVALPNGLLAALLALYSARYEQAWLVTDGVKMVWGSFTFVLGFLLVFRNGQAYSRFRQGAMLMNRVTACWLEAATSFVVFCADEEEKQEKVEHFVQLLIRLFSMLHCAALQQVSEMDDDRQDILNPDGIDPASMAYLMQAENKMEVIIHWIRDLCVVSARDGILTAPPPILSRGIQELSLGQVAFFDVKKIMDVPFPFPYAQVLSSMIIVHWIMTPVLASQACEGWAWAAIVCFLVSFAIWSLLYIALELDQPFGDDDNDLPLSLFQHEFNEHLKMMIRPEARYPPKFLLDSSNDYLRTADSEKFWTSNKEDPNQSNGYGAIS
mmetsp:Transcript_86996/g.153836  ORF Transcript_86996/g.153836 Transcript_86996/m.153836 type:complete len:350 (+) Transcript_86996:126-1175(+)